MSAETLQEARRLVAVGVGTLPIRADASKAPALPAWKEFQARLALDEELVRWHHRDCGLAIICGSISGNREVLDIDDPVVGEEWRRQVDLIDPTIIPRLVEVRTPDGGAHLHYTHTGVQQGSQVLARGVRSDGNVRPLIETRGEGSYVIVPTSPPTCHPAGKPYTLDCGDLAAPPEISGEERALLFDVARQLNEVVNLAERRTKPSGTTNPTTKGTRPGDDYNAQTEWREILEPAGWTYCGRQGNEDRWRRPGKDGQGISATTNHAGSNLLYVFSSHAAPFEIERSYTKFGAFALLYHEGDHSRAARALASQGYGAHESPQGRGGVDPDGTEAEDGRAWIDVTDADLRRIAAEAWIALRKHNDPPRLFAFGGRLARVVGQFANLRHGEGDEIRSNGDFGDMTMPIVSTLDAKGLRYELARAARWSRTTKDAECKPTYPPVPVVEDLLATPVPLMPYLRRVVMVPVFSKQGELLNEPGYHSSSALYYQPAPGFTLPPVAEIPSSADITRARSFIIDDLLGDFPFVGASDRANAIAVLLLPFVRELIDGPTPNHLVEAPCPGSGKGLLVEVLLIPALGRKVAMIPPTTNEEEWRKRITALLRGGADAVAFDNVKEAIDSPSYATALTSTMWEDRVLCTSETVYLPVRCVWVMTANNPRFSTENARRTVMIRLDPGIDRPWLRSRDNFQHPQLARWALEHRDDLVWAALTLVRTWIAAGRPAGEATLGSYEEWAAIIGGILRVGGIEGFLGNQAAFYDAADIEGAVWREFTVAWWACYRDAEVGTADLYPLAIDIPGMHVDQPTEHARRSAFGKRLAEQRDRVFGNYRVVAAGKVQRASRWRLLPTQPKEPSASAATRATHDDLTPGPMSPTEVLV